MRRDNEHHKQEMKKKDLMYADLLAKVCMNFHGKVVARNDSVMAKECASYQVIDNNNEQGDF
jgi:sulfur carrier protein ThiS